ncbi:MAG: prepilin-type N-terminal cleavage/methylation domain-containing protein [Armatimonadota bacterium]|nr:prepilin-type N-terminal cleavage/methylation domain-containing protein [Armatimonadota bacterium]
MRQGRGLTLIEVAVVLAILAILLVLVVPRFLGSRKLAYVHEADDILNELKTMAWGYYQQHSSWEGITSANMNSVLSFQPPDDSVACWDFDLAAPGSATEIQLRAAGDNTPLKCLLVNGATVTLTLHGNGSSTRQQVLP